jgi:uncharacterized protein
MEATLPESRRWFWLGCVTELALLLAAVLLAWACGRMDLLHVRWEEAAVLAGMGLALPCFLAFVWLLRSSSPVCTGLRRILETTLRPVFAPWSLLQLAVIAVLAGVCEEALFRGAVQGVLSGWIGPWPACVAASVLFGLAHPLSRAYMVGTALMGLLLGGLWMLTGNLLAPVVAHAVYDFLALVWFLRVHRPGGSG